MLNLKEFIKIRDFLYRKTGIYMEEGRFELLNSKLSSYLIKNGYDFREFFHTIRFNKEQNVLQDLINIITVNETYFYRETHQFETLINEVLPIIHENKPKDQVIRILCAPSSTGEEPYSIALNILDEGNIINQRDIELVAIDIDDSVIQKANEGIYTKRSVQFIPKYLLMEYFKKQDDKFYIDSNIKNAVNFQVANVMDKNAMRRLGAFDIIFSRNMLIYFDDESRREVGVTFYDMLNKEGYVFLGHADKMNRISSLFDSIKFNDSFVYKK